ncbi:MAG: GNAT family N-acetyltransferase [Bacteroidetes bacterium]|nr:GNAT family N-acetyltransferase [Bacteroidota bacterium]
MVSITIQQATLADLDEVRQLFYDTITKVNVRDYTPEQIAVWSSGYMNLPKWEMRIKEQHFIVARAEEKIIGMISLDRSGYLDLMYVHHAWQGQGIASQLLTGLEKQARLWGLKEIRADVSITARPFFAARGYTISEYNEKNIKGVAFHNAVMRRVLPLS